MQKLFTLNHLKNALFILIKVHLHSLKATVLFR